MTEECRICKSRATRVTYFFSFENRKYLSFWTRLKRKANGGKYHKTAVCDKCYLMCEHGIDTITCELCGFDNHIRLDYLYDSHETFYCCGCGKVLKEVEVEANGDEAPRL